MRNQKGQFIKQNLKMPTKVCVKCGHFFEKNPKFSSKQWLEQKFCGKLCQFSSRRVEKVKKPFIPRISPMKGKHHTLEAKEKNRLAHTKENPISRTKEYRNLKALERWARLKGSDGYFTLDEWFNLKCNHDFKCVHCGKSEEETKLTKDHIIPLSKGGSNYISNIQPLCRSCNSKKHDKILT